MIERRRKARYNKGMMDRKWCSVNGRDYGISKEECNVGTFYEIAFMIIMKNE